MPRLVIGVNGKGHELSQQLLQSCYIALSYGVGHSPSLIPTCFAFPLTPGYKALILSHTLAFSEFLRILSQTNHPTLQTSPSCSDDDMPRRKRVRLDITGRYRDHVRGLLNWIFILDLRTSSDEEFEFPPTSTSELSKLTNTRTI